MQTIRLPFAAISERILKDLASGWSVSLIGLSNTGKSTLMRGLSGPLAEQKYEQARQRPGSLIYIDCNQAVANSAQAFYEVVLRSLLKRLDEILPEHLMNTLRDHHQAITEAETGFAASLSFNLALTELCEQMGHDLCLLLDGFDDIYASLDDRALLNLRALRDRFQSELHYMTATVRNLPRLRGRSVEGEFAELFSHTIYTIPLLDPDEQESILSEIGSGGFGPDRRQLCMRMAGGHPGLLIAAAQILNRLPAQWTGDLLGAISREPQIRAECLKIWEQLGSDEQSALVMLAIDKQAGIAPQQRANLEYLNLVVQATGEIFSPIFFDFVARRGRGIEVETDGIHLDVDSGDVWVNGVRIPVLTDLEFRLLKLLYERQDKISDKYRIVTAVWGEAYLGEVDDARVEKLVSRLRGKIEPDPANPHFILTQRGRGYKLVTKPKSTQ